MGKTAVGIRFDTVGLNVLLVMFGLCLSMMSLPVFAAAEYAHAKSLGKPNVKVMGCPKGGFWDPRNGGECWTCNGHARTVFPVNSSKACKIKAQTHFASATLVESNKNKCTGSSFLDPLTASCWTCPSNSKRSALPVTTKKACSKRIAKKKTKASYVYTVDSLLQKCKKGTFANVGSRKCYQCKSGWKHDASKKVGTNGVCYKPARTQWYSATNVKKISLKCSKGIYDPIKGGSCWTCPSEFKRGIAAVHTSKACRQRVPARMTSPSFISNKDFNVTQVAKGLKTVGCGTYGKKAFFDLKKGGSCWTCPKDQPVRTIFPVDHPKSCATKVCGKENGRPCYVWERIPSCNKGLIEDPFNNKCVKPKNLACVAYVKTMGEMKKAVDKAQAAGTALQDGVLDTVPGARSLIKFTQNQMSHVEGEVEKVIARADPAQLLNPLQDLVVQDPEFMRDFFNTAKLMATKKQQITAMFLDADLMCGGDINKIVKRALDLGVGDLVKPKPPRRSIKMAHWNSGAADYPFSMTDVSPYSNMYASRVIGKGSRNRFVIDFTFDFPYQNGPAKAVFTPGMQLAISLDEPLKGGNGLYFMAGGSVLAAQSIKKGAKAADPTLHISALPDLNIGVGFQWGGLDRDAGHQCYKSGTFAAAGTIKLFGILGIGINDCPVPVSGFGLSLGSVQLGQIDQIAELVFDLPLQTATTTPGGTATVPAPDPYVKPKPGSTPTPGGSGTVLTPDTKTKKSRYKLPGNLEGGGGAELSIRLLPLPKKGEKYAPGGIF